MTSLQIPMHQNRLHNALSNHAAGNNFPHPKPTILDGSGPGIQDRVISFSGPKVSAKSSGKLPQKRTNTEFNKKLKETMPTNDNSAHLTKADTTAGSKLKIPFNDQSKQDNPFEKEAGLDAKVLDRLDLSAITVKEEISDIGDLASIREDFPEWDYCSKMKKSLNEKGVTSNTNIMSSLVSFPSFWAYAKGLNLSKEKEITLKTKLSFLERLTTGCQSFKLPVSLMAEKDQIIAFSAVRFDPKDPLHFNVLRTISIKLTGNYSCPQKGDHWELIGFSSDPANDLRSVGMLGLLQILAFLNMYDSLLREAFDFSTKEVSNPPLCSSLLGATLITLELAKTAKLHPMIINQRSTINAINNMYFAIFYSIYKRYRTDASLSMKNYTAVYREVRQAALKDPQTILDKFNKDMQDFLTMPGLHN